MSKYQQERFLTVFGEEIFIVTSDKRPKHYSICCALEEAQRFRSESDFKATCAKSFRRARRNGCVKFIIAHMRPRAARPKLRGHKAGRSPMRWDFDAVRVEALKYNKRSRFNISAPGAYKAAIRGGFLDEVCGHMTCFRKSGGGSRLKWTPELIKEEALKYEKRVDFGVKSQRAYKMAIKFGILNEVCSHMKPAKRDGSTCWHSYAITALVQAKRSGT